MLSNLNDNLHLNDFLKDSSGVFGVCGGWLSAWRASGADFAAVSRLHLCFLFPKLIGQKNRKWPFLFTEDSRSGGHQVNMLLSLSAEAPVPLINYESKQITCWKICHSVPSETARLRTDYDFNELVKTWWRYSCTFVAVWLSMSRRVLPGPPQGSFLLKGRFF